ncbi:MAG: hypothetical protein FVQ77_14905 [Cytophagales bacterium]|nr:hypothetical protein [Cytophagales bacterium]
MRTIEFETQVENGIIKIPKNITKDVNNKKVKILIKVDRDKNIQINDNMKIQMSSIAYQEWLSSDNDIYDDVFKDEVE